MLLHFLHGPLLKLVASNLLGVHGLFRSLVVAVLAVAVRSNSGLRTAIIRMLMFHHSTSALPVHWRPLRGAHFTPACSSKTTYFSPQDDPCGGRGVPRQNAALWTSGEAPTRVPKQSSGENAGGNFGNDDLGNRRLGCLHWTELGTAVRHKPLITGLGGPCVGTLPCTISLDVAQLRLSCYNRHVTTRAQSRVSCVEARRFGN